MTNTFTVPSIAQKALFDHEIKGQLSDGRWENTRPIGHHKPWCNAEVVVAEEGGKVGRNFHVLRQYDVTKLVANDIVRERMITAVKIVLTFGEPMYGLISKLYDCKGRWRGMATRRAGTTDAEDKIYLQIVELFPTPERLESVRSLIDLQIYTKNELLADLKDLQATMRAVLE